ncbi:MAG TPA: EamA family transporter, partial [Candidatus Binatia bacterium]|nr:EamA family transporter [Candidatus Binatia bacterium]
IVLWGFYGVAYNLAARQIPALPNQVLSTIGLLVPALFLIPSVWRERGQGAGLWVAFVSGLIGAAGNLALLQSLRENGQAAIIFPLTALYPLVTVIIAVLFMRERAQTVQALGIALALVAVVLLSLEPRANKVALRFAPWVFYALAALVAFGLAAVFQKLATNRVSAETAFAMFAAGFVPGAIVICAWEGFSLKFEPAPLAWAIIGGLFNGLGVLATLAAYRGGGKAAVVTPLAAVYPVITVLIAVTFLGEKLNVIQGAGIALAILGALFLSRE